MKPVRAAVSARARPAAGDVKAAVRARALALGFDGVGFAAPERGDGAATDLDAYLAAGFHGDMDWMARTAARRRDPRALWPEVRSVVVLAMTYGSGGDPLSLLRHPGRGIIAAYARGRDYHHVVKKRLKTLAGWMHRTWGCEVKVFVDTAPVMEKPLARRAGLGWQGKHTNLVSTRLGSWFVLGEVFTTLALDADVPHADRCGRCRRCLDVCPTDAFPAPYRLDARRCLSYLTIEHKGHIPRAFRKAMANRIFGCDDCLAVCPWNKFARRTAEMAFLPRAELTAPRLADLATLDDAGFRETFRGSPVKRLGRARFIRNVLIALGNAGEPAAASVILPHLDDPSPLVRVAAVWALSRILKPAHFETLRARHLPAEQDPAVRGEWEEGAATDG